MILEGDLKGFQENFETFFLKGSDTARCERAGWGEYCPLSEPIRLQDL